MRCDEHSDEWHQLTRSVFSRTAPQQVAYEMQSVGLDGTTLRPFEKPLTTTFVMFLAMAMGR